MEPVKPIKYLLSVSFIKLSSSIDCENIVESNSSKTIKLSLTKLLNLISLIL